MEGHGITYCRVEQRISLSRGCWQVLPASLLPLSALRQGSKDMYQCDGPTVVIGSKLSMINSTTSSALIKFGLYSRRRGGSDDNLI